MIAVKIDYLNKMKIVLNDVTKFAEITFKNDGFLRFAIIKEWFTIF